MYSVAYSLFWWRIVLQLWVSFIVAFATRDSNYLYPVCTMETGMATRHALIFATLAILPRIAGAICCGYRARRFGRDAPIGAWVFIGNPFPEYGVRVVGKAGAYPGQAYEDLSVRYVQCPTWGGIAVGALHCLAKRQFYPKHIFASDARAVEGYWLPILHDGNDTVEKWQRELIFISVAPGVWARRETTNPDYTLYYWVHDSIAPWDDCLEMPQPPMFRCAMGVLLLAVYAAVNVFTMGLVAVIDTVDMILKRQQIRIITNCYAPK